MFGSAKKDKDKKNKESKEGKSLDFESGTAESTSGALSLQSGNEKEKKKEKKEKHKLKLVKKSKNIGKIPQCGNIRIFLSFRFYVKSISKNLGSELYPFDKFHPSISAKMHKNQNSEPFNV